MSVHLIAACGDLHAGSTVALSPPEGIELDDGNMLMPNAWQLALWEYWREAWDVRFRALMEQYRPDRLTVVFNGDLVDGIHHFSPQVAPLSGQHFRAAHDILKRGPLQYKPDYVHVVRGTESHVGRAGELEEGLARTMRAEGVQVVRDPDTNQVSSYWRRIDVQGRLIDCRHHGRFGQRTHTKDSYLRLYAHDIWEAHVRSGERPPDLCLRSHLHNYGDSGRIVDLPTRVIALPAWQRLTAHGHKLTIEDLGKFGICAVPVRDGEILEPHPILFEPERPTIVEAR
jgi:hypothetical protein